MIERLIGVELSLQRHRSAFGMKRDVVEMQDGVALLRLALLLSTPFHLEPL
jgi:hypothetical protein